MKIVKVKNKNLSREYQNIINRNRIKEFGSKNKKDFSKDYEAETLWFFLKEKDKIVAFGGIRPIKVEYLKKIYHIGGICSIISIVKGKGYGGILISFMRSYANKNKKTILGFTKKTEFFKKVGLQTKKDFVKRFIYKNLETGREIIDNDGDGIYYEGRDKLISRMLKGKSKAYIEVLHW